MNNCWELLHYGVKRYNYVKFIGIRELSERFALNLFNNTFSTDYRNMEKNMHLLDEVDAGDAVTTYFDLHFYSSTSNSTDLTTISDLTFNTPIPSAYTLLDSTFVSQKNSEK